MASLAHTQANWTQLIQISDLVGEYGVDFLVMLVGRVRGRSFADCFLLSRSRSSAFRNRRFAALRSQCCRRSSVSQALSLYGYWRLVAAEHVVMQRSEQNLARGLLSFRATAWRNGSRTRTASGKSWRSTSSFRKRSVSQAPEGDGRPIDLIVWPETMFRTPLVTFDAGYQLPANAVNYADRDFASYAPQELAALVRRLGTPVLVGIDRAHSWRCGRRRANRRLQQFQLFRARRSRRQDRRHVRQDAPRDVRRVHSVCRLVAVPVSDHTAHRRHRRRARSRPRCELDGKYCFAPNICYETVIPHVIRRQVATLDSSGEPPTCW